MNKVLLVLCLVFLVSCSPKEVPIDLLVEMQGIKYEVNSQTPFTGISFENYDNGQLKLKRNYKDGKQQGLVKVYHENGQLRAKGNYKDGRKDGLWESYYDYGKLLSISCHDNGKKVEMFYNDQIVDMSYCEK